MFVITPFVSFAVTFLLLGIFLRWPGLLPIQDIPNERSLHTQTIPRIGGIALMAGVVLACVSFSEKGISVIVLPIVILVAISLVDDIRGVAAKWRLLAQLCATAIFVLNQSELTLLFGIPFVIAIVWMTNLYNFMDGSDGLAGGMAVVGFSVYAIAALFARQSDLAVISFSIAGSAMAFLLYNFPPAKVFLGDVGSIPLGFAAGSIGLLGWNSGAWPLWFPLLVFSAFIVDATLTLTRRLSRREKVWNAW
jgi:UDP-GlcNAc:undecaprenyl-phosphate/decaprenyl-phosphate GlcNAc-1-phosphate transferase